jgi:hypothetical protein
MRHNRLPVLTPEQKKFQMELARRMSPTAKMFPPKPEPEKQGGDASGNRKK